MEVNENTIMNDDDDDDNELNHKTNGNEDQHNLFSTYFGELGKNNLYKKKNNRNRNRNKNRNKKSNSLRSSCECDKIIAKVWKYLINTNVNFVKSINPYTIRAVKILSKRNKQKKQENFDIYAILYNQYEDTDKKFYSILYDAHTNKMFNNTYIAMNSNDDIIYYDNNNRENNNAFDEQVYCDLHNAFNAVDYYKIHHRTLKTIYINNCLWCTTFQNFQKNQSHFIFYSPTTRKFLHKTFVI